MYQSEKQLKDNAEKISEDNKASLESAIEDAKKTLANDSSETSALKAENERLMEALNKIGEEIHAASAASSGAGPEDSGTPPPDAEPQESDPAAAKQADVVDADFEVVEEEEGSSQTPSQQISLSYINPKPKQ